MPRETPEGGAPSDLFGRICLLSEGEKHGIRQLSITGAAGQRGGVLPSTDGTAARERIVTEVIWTGAGEGDGPKELSLVYQRDARRYDGGFSLY